MWTLLVLCSVIISQGVQGAARYYATTEGRPSCRYYCGYNMGSCSCESSCQYRGNCCPDYYSYCDLGTTAYTTTTPAYSTYPAETTTAPDSCSHYCGYNMGSCSCESSCQYRGNCCPDFYSYCDLGTTYPPAYTTTPPAYTTGQPSCRYYCGYNMGSCSCESSCQYRGNCCPDYYSYCDLGTTAYTTTPPSHTTYPADTTTGQPSCRHYCGYNMGSCSCESSCQYSGNCCYDYYSHCSFSTASPGATTAGPCGGPMFGSGTFSSPNYPNYYQDNTNCIWQLRTSYDQIIALSFTYLQLENCCSCDYIAVYDGPTTGSRYLGKVCNNNNNSTDIAKTFYSSSNYLTVRFRTDSSVVGRGFNAEFISALPQSSGHVDCSDKMNIVIARSYLASLGYDGQNLYVNDQYCRPTVSSNQVVFSFPINSCGTVQKFENGRIVYHNNVRAFTSNYGDITRQSHFKMNVGCRMEQDSVSQIMYVVSHHDNSTLTGTGRFNTSMDFYSSSSFYYKVIENPYEVVLNQNLYVQVDLRRGDSTLVLFLDTCVASPSPHDFQSRSYYLVRNGCPADNTYRSYTSGTRPYARFTFKAFQFLRATESVYIQCKVLICPASDNNSRCRRGCTKRAARDVGSKHDSQTLVLGPIQLKEPEKKKDGTNEQEKA